MWGKTVRGMEVCEAPHERCRYGNCEMHVGRYLVYVGLDCEIMSQDGRNAYPWHGLLN